MEQGKQSPAVQEAKQLQETALTSLVQAEVNAVEGIMNREQVYEIMDRIDEIAMMRGVGNEVLQSCVYKFVDKSGKEVVGLSKVGVDTAVKELANMGEVIREEDVTFTDSGDAYFFIARSARYAVDKNGHETKLETATGFKRQPKKAFQNVKVKDPNTGKVKYGNDGNPITEYKEVDNPFAFEHGGIKAVRNAKRRLINESLIRKLIENKLTGGKYLEIKVNNLISETAESQAAQPKAEQPKPAEGTAGQTGKDDKKSSAVPPPADNTAEMQKIYKQFKKEFIIEVILPKYSVARFGEIPYDKIKAELPMLLEQQKKFKPGQAAAAASAAGNKITSFIEKGVRYDCCSVQSGAIVNKVDLSTGETVSSYTVSESSGKITCSCPATRTCKHIHLFIQHNKEKNSRIITEAEWEIILKNSVPTAAAAPAPSAPPSKDDLPPNPLGPPPSGIPLKKELQDRKFWEAEKTRKGTKETVVKYFNEVFGLRGTKLFNFIMKATGSSSFNNITSNAYEQLYRNMFNYTQKRVDEILEGGK